MCRSTKKTCASMSIALQVRVVRANDQPVARCVGIFEGIVSKEPHGTFRVVRDDIDIAVVVDVSGAAASRDEECATEIGLGSGFVGERSVAVIAIEEVGFRESIPWR